MAFPFDMSGQSPLTKMGMLGPGMGPLQQQGPASNPGIIGMLQQIIGPPMLQAGMQQTPAVQKTHVDEHELLVSILDAMQSGKLTA